VTRRTESARTIIRRSSLFAIAIAVVLLAAVALLVLGRADPIVAFEAMFSGAFGSWSGFGETLIRFAPLALVALGLTPSLRIGLFNIGAPGQIAAGGLVATLVSLNFPNFPAFVVLTLACVGAAGGGALCAFIPAILRARLFVSEILSTLVFNFLMVLFLQYLLTGPMKGYRANLPESDAFPAGAFLPTFVHGSRAHLGILLVFIAFVAVHVLNYSPVGYRLRLLGASRSLARQAGISEARMIIATLCFGGAAAGIAGWVQAAGVDHRLYASIADPIGYTGLFAALMGGLMSVGVLVSSFFFAALLRGGDSLQIGADVSPEIVGVLVGLIMLVMAATEARFRHGEAAS
jgi:general nucleoside transport system permease protein